jgi:uncharacterized protein
MELQTTETSLQEQKEWEKNKTVSKGFSARMGLNVSTSEISRLGEVLSTATKLGVRELGQMNTYVSKELFKKERETCLEEAIRNARGKAEKMAKVEGIRVGRVLQVTENSGAVQAPVPMYRAKMAMAEDATESAPTIEAKQEKISVSISASYELK